MAIKEYLLGNKSLRETASVLGCSHEQIRLLMGTIFKTGVIEGWITVDFDKL